jgi:hypothetical protein
MGQKRRIKRVAAMSALSLIASDFLQAVGDGKKVGQRLPITPKDAKHLTGVLWICGSL